MFGTPPGGPCTPQGVQTNHNEDADEERPLPQDKVVAKFLIKGRAWLHLKDRWACTIGVQSLRHWTRQFLPKFSTTANFTLFNAVRLGPDDFNVLDDRQSNGTLPAISDILAYA